MKRSTATLICISLILALAVGYAAKAPKQEDTLTGSVADILQALTDEANNILPEDSKMLGTFNDPVTADNSENATGLTAEEFDKYVEEAYTAQAMIITSAHQVSLIKCKDFAAAAEVKKLVANFNTGKWICVIPDKATAIDSGTYVLLLVSSDEYTDAALAAFKTLAKDNTGEANTFYTKAA
ncbi:MAG: hypothetical protein LBN30_05880 [Oscillospiraceae bacterium]|jgi:hypothetical protein|nr:hypothetical protein [Oscillospiraceae bacterium]